ncbi:MAG TPA: UDP-3-O-(3-hydroxymyristoyl)glucosamine N-acyltransferase [Geobacteraceae bacterium]
MEKTVQELADYLGGQVRGDGTARIKGLGPLDDAGEGQVTFLANPRYAAKVATTRATAVILPPGAEGHGRTVIEVANPYLAFAKLLTLFYVQPLPSLGVMAGAIVAPTAVLGEGVTLFPGAVVSDGVTIGDRTTLFPGVVLYPGVSVGADVVLHANVCVRERCRIGNRVIVQNGAVIGSDGFGYAPDGSSWYRIPQIGIVVVEDDVEIGANTTIDRAALEATLIRKGTKIDNLVQVAHNCVIGENCMIVSQVGISGSAKLGNHVTLGGQVGIAGHLSIGDNTMIGAQSGVPGNIPAGQVMSGSPVIPHRDWLKASAAFSHLPAMRKTLAALEKRVAELEEQSTPAAN